MKRALLLGAALLVLGSTAGCGSDMTCPEAKAAYNAGDLSSERDHLVAQIEDACGVDL